ncbi:transposase for IS26 [Klebsiella pneumoniae]|nr:transposase for IS26 [Klebsiella pneumoniae]
MNPFKGRHFQRDIILWAVRWYCKYGISYRELQEMLAERGVNVDHSTIYRWVQRYAPEMEKRLRWYWRNPSDLCPWHMDETYYKGFPEQSTPVFNFCLFINEGQGIRLRYYKRSR